MSREWLSRFVRPEAVFFLLVWGVFLVLFRERGFYDPGTLWHTVVGERVLQHGFMTTDPFTYTHEGRTWIPQQWGGEVLMALAHRLGGFDTMLLAFATGVAALHTWFLARLRQAGMHWALAGGLAGGALFVAAFHFYIRPHMTTMAFLAITTAALVEFDRGRLSLSRLACLIPFCVLWTNVHGGVLGGVLSFGVAGAGWGALYLLKRGGPITTFRVGVVVLGILLSCALTPFDSPFGMEMINTWQRIVGSKVMPLVVNEHKPISLASPVDQMLVLFAVLYTALFAGTLPNLRREFRATWLVPFVWMALMAQGIRQGPLFVMTAAIVLADFWPHTVWQALLKKHGDSLAYGGTVCLRPVTWTLPVLAVGTALGLQVARVPAPVFGSGWVRMPREFVPVDLTVAIDHELANTPGEARLFNDCNLGGYLIYYHPRQKIFMDDRFELYGDAWLDEYVQSAWHHPEAVERYSDRYGCTHALVAVEKPATPFDTYLSGSDRWREVARGTGAVLFRRKLGPPTPHTTPTP